MPLAAVYPLVSSRAVARPFTYEVEHGVAKGAVVAVRFGRAAQRGVVVETGVEAPAGIEPAPIERVLYELPPALVDLALWVADYYGSTPARGPELLAPPPPPRRGEPRGGGRRGVRGRARPRARRDRARARDRPHAAGARPLPGALRRSDRGAALRADGGGAAR